MSKRQKPDQKQLFNSLAKDLHELVGNKQTLRTSVEHFLNNLIDEITLGIIFDLHRKYKTNAYDLEVDDSCEDDDSEDLDIASQYNFKKIQDCNCPNCGRAVAATRFAPHLETCMGKGRLSRSRNASRRVATNSNDRENSYGEIPSDDEEEANWNSGDRRKKKKAKNGGKKNRVMPGCGVKTVPTEGNKECNISIPLTFKKCRTPKIVGETCECRICIFLKYLWRTTNCAGTPKKVLEQDPVESVNVDVEGDDDDLTNLRDILHLQDHSNSTSPADSASSSGSVKKKDKSKNKKIGKKDRTSPCSSISLE